MDIGNTTLEKLGDENEAENRFEIAEMSDQFKLIASLAAADMPPVFSGKYCL